MSSTKTQSTGTHCRLLLLSASRCRHRAREVTRESRCSRVAATITPSSISTFLLILFSFSYPPRESFTWVIEPITNLLLTTEFVLSLFFSSLALFTTLSLAKQLCHTQNALLPVLPLNFPFLFILSILYFLRLALHLKRFADKYGEFEKSLSCTRKARGKETADIRGE